MSKQLNTVGFSLFGGGILLMAGYGLYNLMKDLDVPPVIKMGIIMILFGIMFLFASVALERQQGEDENIGDE